MEMTLDLRGFIACSHITRSQPFLRRSGHPPRRVRFRDVDPRVNRLSDTMAAINLLGVLIR